VLPAAAAEAARLSGLRFVTTPVLNLSTAAFIDINQLLFWLLSCPAAATLPLLLFSKYHCRLRVNKEPALLADDGAGNPFLLPIPCAHLHLLILLLLLLLLLLLPLVKTLDEQGTCPPSG
jgi:hypothetical protein